LSEIGAHRERARQDLGWLAGLARLVSFIEQQIKEHGAVVDPGPEFQSNDGEGGDIPRQGPGRGCCERAGRHPLPGRPHVCGGGLAADRGDEQDACLLWQAQRIGQQEAVSLWAVR
jgi:hypothetical protein